MLHRFISFFSSVVFVSVLFTVGCSAQQTEEQALESLRQLTRDGKLPPESVVANIESRFAGKRTGALAKLLHGRIKYENGDFAGAAAILNSNDFQQKTNVADYALWLRGKALQQAGNHAEAITVFAKLLSDFPASLRVREAKLLWATSAIAAGRAVEGPPFLVDLTNKNDADALLLTAKAFEAQTSQAEAIKYYRRTYFFGAGSAAAKEAEAKLTSLGQPLTPQTGDEQLARADRFLLQKNYKDATAEYSELSLQFPGSIKGAVALRFFTAALNERIKPSRGDLFAAIAPENLEQAYRELVLAYAKAKMWAQTRSTADEMRAKFPNGKLVAKTFIDAGLAARDARNRTDEGYFLNAAVAAFPNAIEVAQAQFESAWFQHEAGYFAESSRMFVEHLARYADKDTTNRGKAGYWAARDSERAGKTAEACALYAGVIQRYSANWYGYIGLQRLTALKGQGQCGASQNLLAGSFVPKAVSSLRTVTVAAETSTAKELERGEKSQELSAIGLFDWAISELEEAKKTANNSPKINLALAKYYRLKGDNVNAFLALAKSYPDYSQMLPEEMGREEWDIFYPLSNWDQISAWAKNRNLDQYQIAGLIRQESVFNPRAKSGANAYGLMQLLPGTARLVAKKYGSTADLSSAESLFLPALNIELGTGYMRDQFDKFGRIEYVAVAYNAGPGRVPQWRATLPIEIDEFVEAIPFKETKAYVQGVIRNSAQYRRLYDENGNFRTNVGTRPLRGEIDSLPRDKFTADFPDVLIDDRAASE